MNYHTQLLQLIARCKQKKFTGRIIFQSQSKVTWQLYFSVGEIVWLNGGLLPYRSWSRHLQQYAHHLNYHQFSAQEYRRLELFPSACFSALAQRNLLEGVSLNSMLNHRMTEMFFDILQAGSSQPLKVKVYQDIYDGFAAEELKQYWHFIQADKLILKAKNDLELCLKQGGFWSLNLAPKVAKEVNFSVNSNTVNSNLTRLFDGKSTIRDLALKLNQDVIKLSFSLLPYIRRGWIELVEVADIGSESSQHNSTINRLQVVTNSLKPLIYCVDDNALNCYLMENIIGSLGYRFLSTQRPMTVMSKLIKAKPDLIFLDIVMPGIDGFTLCKAIRNISALKAVPIIMLTGEENLSAQVRARNYGANEFIHKPIIKEKIISVVNKYLSAPRFVQ